MKYPTLMLKSLFVLSLMFLFSAKANGQWVDIGVHDPVMAKEDARYYIFHTGRGISMWSSPDMKNWEREDPIFEEAPQWTYDVNPNFNNSMWAPDITRHNGTWYLYYSVSAFGRNRSAIAVATNSTLNPDDPDYKWVDHGPVVQSVPGRDMWNAIDPNIVYDDDGNPWMAFGSFWMGLKIFKLDGSMTRPDPSQKWRTIAARHRYWKLDERDAGDSANPELNYDELYPEDILKMNRNMENGAIEAPFIFKKNGYYYLFASWDRCCRGLESTYKIVVGRSKNITGPYLDRKNKKMLYGGGTLVAKGNEDWAAVGHSAAYTFNGTDYLIAHAYDKADEGHSKLILTEIKWDEEGWPHVSIEK